MIIASASVFGQRASLIFQTGKRVLKLDTGGEGLDKRLMRFNNSIAAISLGLPVVGWALSLLVVVAAGVALAGFCVGCFLYYQFKLQRYRLISRL